MEVFLCELCNKEFNSEISRRKHLSRSHGIKSIDTYIKYQCNGVIPTCECGCGDTTKFLGENKGFRRFISGHNSSVGTNNFQIRPEIKEKSAKTQKENWENGKYKGWWENDDEETKQKIEGIKGRLRNDKERGRKISKSLTGIKKSDEHKKKVSESQIKRYDENPELREVLSNRRVKWLKSKLSSEKSNLEKLFEVMLVDMSITYINQYEVKKRLFDFYIPLNNTLIEVDGDFYHCNPNSKHITPKYKCQFLSIKNDMDKNLICLNENITLLRYWEKDIKERPEWVISDLKEKLNIT